MLLKCGRNEYELTGKDVILHNGASYILITRKVKTLWNHSTSPTVANWRVEKAIKQGLLKEVKVKNPPYYGDSFKYYAIAQEEK